MRQEMRLLACLVWFITVPALAQRPPTSDTPATRADILRLFRVMDTQAQVRQVMEQVMQQMRTLNREQLGKRRPDISEDELARMDKESEEIANSFPVDEIMEDMIPVYQKHLTKGDVDAMIAFYSSPTGKKLLREMPAISAEGMQAVYPRMQKNLDAILRRIDEQANEPKPKPAPEKPQPKN